MRLSGTAVGELNGQADGQRDRADHSQSLGLSGPRRHGGIADAALTKSSTIGSATAGLPAGPPAIEINGLRKTYGALVAVDNVSLSVTEGEIFGILGPNGAGKTTAVECAIGLRVPDSGTIRLLGLDPRADREQVHEIVGVQLQASAMPARLKVGEVLDLYRSFYREPADVAELTEALGLAGKLNDYYKSLSGGQRQRLSVALALIGRPKIAVLDEMTTGLDPQARRDAWGLIEHIRDRGVTVLLVTHFMDEAERLCDRVALFDSGRVVALDTPANLAARARGGKVVRFRPSGPFDDQVLRQLPEVTQVERQSQHVAVTGTGELVNAVLFALAAVGVSAIDVQLDTSNLEDAFVKLTGSHMNSEGALT
jgi:ABC-2 type transport system ATP-binding protein